MTVSGHNTETYKQNRLVTIEGDLTSTVSGNKTLLVKILTETFNGNKTIEVKQNLVETFQTVNSRLKSTKNITVDGNATETYKTNKYVNIDG